MNLRLLFPCVVLWLGCPADSSFPPLRVVAGQCDARWSAAERPLAKVPDTNADGVAEVLTATEASEGVTPRVSLRSGLEGKVLWTREVAREVGLAQLEDLDGNGTTELLLGTVVPPTQSDCVDNCGSPLELHQYHLETLNVADGTQRWARAPQTAFPMLNERFAVLTDEDGDSVRELVLGAHYTTHEDPVALQVVSGATGAPLRTLAPPADSAESYGERLVTIPDLDGDDRLDLLVSDSRGPFSHYAAGRLTAISSASGALLWERTGQQVEGAILYGDGLATLQRPDHGFPDVIVGAHNSTAPDQEGEPGVVEVLDGRTGARRLLLVGRRAHEHFGQAVADMGDLNGDGVADIGIGSPMPGLPVQMMGEGGRFSVHSGVDGAVLLDVEEQVDRDQLSNFFGHALLGLGDRTDQHQSPVVVQGSVLREGQRTSLTLAYACRP